MRFVINHPDIEYGDWLGSAFTILEYMFNYQDLNGEIILHNISDLLLVPNNNFINEGNIC